MPRHLLLLLAGLALVVSMGCGRWMVYAPARMIGQVQDPRVVYQRLVHRAQTMGYCVERADPQRGYFVVRAFLDQRRRCCGRRASFFHVNVYNDGTVDVSANGFHLRDGGTVIHRKLCNELNRFVAALAHEIHPGPVMVGVR
jgi:hypothetical protein